MYNKSSTTSTDEKYRITKQQLNKAYFKNNRKFGTVKEVHEKLYAVTVLLEEGGMALGGQFIPVVNSWQQLIHDFGNLRPGLLVEITFIGDQESTSEARIIGLEGEKIAQQQEKPEVNLALYEIFSPGV